MDRDARPPNPFVRKLEGFAPLSEFERGMLERISADARPVDPRVDLVHEGEKPEGVFLIMEGMACRYKRRASGVRQIMAYMVPGDLCDLDVALLDTMDHSLATLSPCKVARIDPGTIGELKRDHPQITHALRLCTLVDQATLREWLLNLGRRSSDERLAHLFCELLLRLQAVGLAPEGRYALPVTQHDLADTTGLSAVHVNRTLQTLRRSGLIALDGGTLSVLDLAGLKALAEFKSNYLHLDGWRAA